MFHPKLRPASSRYPQLSYRHAENRFRGYVWYRAPEADSDIASELFNLLFEIERQLNAPYLGNYHIAGYQQGLKTHAQGGGRLVATSGRRSAPYLLRQARWQEAGTLLERLLQRDRSPATLAFALPLRRGDGTRHGRHRRPGQSAIDGRPHGRRGSDAPRRDLPQRPWRTRPAAGPKP